MITPPFTPYPHQREAHDRRKRFTVLVWHRRAGKTVFSILELILAALAFVGVRGRFAYISPKLKEAKDTAWDYLKHYTADVPGRVVNESESFVLLPNGARLRIYGADDPDSLRGPYLDGVVMDEVAQMKPEVWGEVIRPMLSDRQGWALFIGTPKGVNLFSKLYYEAQEARSAGDWWPDLRRWTDTGVVPDVEIASNRRSMSAAQFAQEFECDFSAAVSNALISLEDVLAATRRTIPKAEYSFAARILGVDVARYGDDKSVIAKRQGLLCLPFSTFSKLDTMATSGQVARAIEEWQPHATFIDGGGLGSGVVDRVRQLGFRVYDVNFGQRALQETRFEHRREEMWWLMAEWVKAGSLPPEDNVLISELTAPTFSYANARGRMQLESKDDMRKRGLPSPDKADALALTFAAPVAAPERPEDVFVRRTAPVEFNPYKYLRGEK